MHTPHDLDAAGTMELLRTKLAPPRVRADRVARPALLTRLHAGLDHKLTLVSAPAGWGKTTLVTGWLHALTETEAAPPNTQAHSIPPLSVRLSPSPAAWVTLDEGDNDPVRFWRYVITACQTFDSATGTAALALLNIAQSPPFPTILTHLINELARLERRCVLVLDDYHVITAPDIHEAVAFLLDHLPATLHLVIITRTDPPLPLARLRARHELHELGAADLRFSTAETTTFLEQALAAPLPPAAIARLDAQIEGWAAGLRLFALALHGRSEPQEIEQIMATFSGRNEHIMTYLLDEVLRVQPAPVQRFLLKTSVLSSLCASLCDAITGETGSEQILQQLERANVFLVPLDSEQQWFRYHALFAQAMQHEARRRLGDAGVRAVYRRASHWYEQHAQFADAVEAGLAAGDMARAAVLIERVIAPQLVKNEHHTLRRWIAQLPQDVLRDHPVLCLSYASAILFTSDRRAPATMALLHPPLHMAEQRWRAAEHWDRLGAVLAFRAMATWWQGDWAQSFADAREALRVLPPHDTQWRGICLIFTAAEAWLAGNSTVARQTLGHARAHNEAAGNVYGMLSVTNLLGNVHMQQGELHQTEQLYHQALALADQTHDALDNEAQALLGLAALAYEWNDLAAAEQRAAEARDVGQYLADEELMVHGALIMAQVQQARGNPTQAQQLLHTLAAQTSQRWPLLRREIEAAQARLALTIGNTDAAQRWQNNTRQHGTALPRMQEEREALITARLLLAQGDTGAALDLIHTWQADAQEHGRVKSELDMLILAALAHAAADQLPEAKHTLLAALPLAQAEGYQRVFLDEGAALATLLRAIVPDVRGEPAGQYVYSLLRAVDQERTGPNAPLAPLAGSLVEPLSPQEQRVLRLLVAGLSNADIARELIVSVNTIKTQIKSIYRKLDVRSRAEARSAARELDLI